MVKNIIIRNREIGNNKPIFFIAEAGVNHNGSIEYAKKLVDIAVESGSDAIKFQTFKAENLNTKNAPKSTYHIETTGNDEKQSWYDLLKSQEISPNMHKEIISYCNKKEIIFLSTPYDFESAKLLESFDVPAFKIASTDTNNIPLLKNIARIGKPMIISTAMCNFEEVQEAVSTIRNEGLRDIIVCQCTGNYPAKLEDTNLNVINTYKKELDCLVGYSDHTLENINPILATGLGICLYEKHFTIDQSLEGPDHRMSLNPDQLKKTIDSIRLAEIALGSNRKKVLKDEIENRKKLRKSIVSSRNINKGELITENMLQIKRPGNGISPKNLKKLIGMYASTNIEADQLILNDMLQENK